MPDKMTKKARKLTRKGWTFRFARTEKDKNKAVELFRTVDGIAGNAVFDGDILVAESPHHSIAGAALLGSWEDANGLRHCLVRVLAVAPDKQGKGVGTALLWATHAAARGIEVFGGCSAANEGLPRGGLRDQDRPWEWDGLLESPIQSVVRSALKGFKTPSPSSRRTIRLLTSSGSGSKRNSASNVRRSTMITHLSPRPMRKRPSLFRPPPPIAPTAAATRRRRPPRRPSHTARRPCRPARRARPGGRRAP